MPTFTGVQPQHIGPRYDFAIGYDPGTGTVLMVGYILAGDQPWSRSTVLEYDTNYRYVASPNQIDSRDLSPWPRITQGDWSGGERQVTYVVGNRFFQSSGVETSVPGHLTLSAAATTVTPDGTRWQPNFYTPVETNGRQTFVGGKPVLTVNIAILSPNGALSYEGVGGNEAIDFLRGPRTMFGSFSDVGIWQRSQTSSPTWSQVTNDLTDFAADPGMAYFNGRLYYTCGQTTQTTGGPLPGRCVMYVDLASPPGAGPGTLLLNVNSGVEGWVHCLTATATGLFFALTGGEATTDNPNQPMQSILYTFDGTTTSRVGTVEGFVKYAHTVANTTYFVVFKPKDPGVGPPIPMLYALSGSTITLLDDMRSLGVNGASPFWPTGTYATYGRARLEGDDRWLYLAWPGMPVLRYDLAQSPPAVSETGSSGTITGTLLNAHRYVRSGGFLSDVVQDNGTLRWIRYSGGPATNQTGTLTTSWLDTGTPTVTKLWRGIEVSLNTALPTGAAISVQYRTQNAQAWQNVASSFPIPSGVTFVLPPGVLSSQLQLLITMTAGSGGGPDIRYVAVKATLGRVWKYRAACLRNLTDRAGTPIVEQPTGTTGMRVADMIGWLRTIYNGSGRCYAYVSSPEAGQNPSSGAPYVELVTAELVTVDEQGIPGETPGWAVDTTGNLDLSANVDLTLVETL